jgi:hypothetical protein
MTTYSLRDLPTAILTQRALDNAKALDQPNLSASVAKSLIRQLAQRDYLLARQAELALKN